MRTIVSLFSLLLFACTVTAQSLPVTGVEGGSLKQIVGTPTLITAVLKDVEAKDANLRLIELHENYLVALNEKDERVVYTYDSLKEVHVQEGAIEKKALTLPTSAAMRTDDQAVVNRAIERLKELFQNSNGNQQLKLRAAALLTLSGDEKSREYLKQLLESNNLEIQLFVNTLLYVSGNEPNSDITLKGLKSGSRANRSAAAVLSGASNYTDATPFLMEMVQDRAAELSAPAACALASMGNREVIPRLLTLLGEKNKLKNEAAIYGLSKLGGEDIIEQMKMRLKTAQGLELFHTATILFNLGDPEGIKQLKIIFKEKPTLTPDAALILGTENDWDAIQYLHSRLTRRENPTESNLMYRMKNAMTLIKSGDPSALTVFQGLLHEDADKVKIAALDEMAFSKDRRFLQVIRAYMESNDPQIALTACNAALSFAYPDASDRAKKLRHKDTQE